jgi:hypothetical protein
LPSLLAREVNVQEVPCTDDFGRGNSKIKAMVARWVKAVEIVELRLITVT